VASPPPHRSFRALQGSTRERFSAVAVIRNSSWVIIGPKARRKCTVSVHARGALPSCTTVLARISVPGSHFLAQEKASSLRQDGIWSEGARVGPSRTTLQQHEKSFCRLGRRREKPVILASVGLGGSWPMSHGCRTQCGTLMKRHTHLRSFCR